MKKNYAMDMTQGPILGKMIRYCLPIMLTGILQLLYNAADVIVVGRFAGAQALAAVGSTGSITHLLVSVFLGMSAGVGVKVAQYFGAKAETDLSETVHTSVTVGLVAGVGLSVVGVLCARTFLIWMDTPADVIDLSTKYMRIIFLGMPGQMLYNFAAAVLRSIGDTKRPLYFLTLSGIVNVIMNLFFVIGCGMDVDGVAIATIVSQYLSAILAMLCLIRDEGSHRFEWRKMKIHGQKLREIVYIGLPAGLQSGLFGISNVLLQSGVNSFGSATMAACAAASNIEGFVYTSMYSFHQGVVTVIGQNVGARKPERFHRTLLVSLGLVAVVGIVMGGGVTLLGRPLLSIYNQDPEIIAIGIQRLTVVCVPYFLCGLMDVLSGALRGMGYSLAPFFVSIFGVCGVRILWIYTVFAKFHTVTVLYLSYMVTWSITILCHLICYLILSRKKSRELIAERETISAMEKTKGRI